MNVNAIAPGYLSTNSTTALRDDETRSKEILARIPAARRGEVADIGGAVVKRCHATLVDINPVFAMVLHRVWR